jgi:hypothetical protein
MDEQSLTAARVLMGDSLGFHIIFVMFSLTLPILVSWFEFMGIRRKDPKLTEIANVFGLARNSQVWWRSYWTTVYVRDVRIFGGSSISCTLYGYLEK